MQSVREKETRIECGARRREAGSACGTNGVWPRPISECRHNRKRKWPNSGERRRTTNDERRTTPDRRQHAALLSPPGALLPGARPSVLFSLLVLWHAETPTLAFDVWTCHPASTLTINSLFVPNVRDSRWWSFSSSSSILSGRRCARRARSLSKRKSPGTRPDRPLLPRLLRHRRTPTSLPTRRNKGPLTALRGRGVAASTRTRIPPRRSRRGKSTRRTSRGCSPSLSTAPPLSPPPSERCIRRKGTATTRLRGLLRNSRKIRPRSRWIRSRRRPSTSASVRRSRRKSFSDIRGKSASGISPRSPSLTITTRSRDTRGTSSGTLATCSTNPETIQWGILATSCWETLESRGSFSAFPASFVIPGSSSANPAIPAPTPTTPEDVSAPPTPPEKRTRKVSWSDIVSPFRIHISSTVYLWQIFRIVVSQRSPFDRQYCSDSCVAPTFKLFRELESVARKSRSTTRKM